MILIADSGSTKTAWRLIDEKKHIHQFSSEGIHPLFCDQQKIISILQQQLCSNIGFPPATTIDEIYFYGAGCSSAERNRFIEDALKAVFTQAKTEVASDLTGAARGLYGHQEGIVAILGTGSSSGTYDGKIIVHSRPSLGYILGDEGSGAYLGKQLLQDFLYGNLPEKLSIILKEQYKLDKEKITQSVYRDSFPNRYLASYSHFILRHIQDEYCAHLVYNSFLAFIDKHIRYYDTTNLSFSATGSVAYFYSNILRKACEVNDIRFTSATEHPAAGLALYHLGEL